MGELFVYRKNPTGSGWMVSSTLALRIMNSALGRETWVAEDMVLATGWGSQGEGQHPPCLQWELIQHSPGMK